MQTQKDRVDAYKFLIGRMSSALVVGDATHAEPPDRRSWFGLLCGLALGVLVGVGFWVYGLIVPGGNTAWQEKGAILVEKETGTRYVYSEGLLRPVLNQASAMLFEGKEGHVKSISRASLEGLPHGAPLGLLDAPDSLPTTGNLVNGPWMLCLNGRPGEPASMSMMLDVPAAPRLVLGDSYVSVISSADVRYLIIDHIKYRLGDESAAIALGLPNRPQPLAPDAWLDALPEGPALSAAAIADDGKPGGEVAGSPRRIGQLFRQRNVNGTDQLYVLRKDGLSPLTETEFALLAARHADRPPVGIDAAAVVAAPRSTDMTLTQRIPDVLKAKPVDVGLGVVCLIQNPVGVQVASAVVVADTQNAGRPMTGGAGATMKPNTGMFAAAVPVPLGQTLPARYLITDRGIKYLVPDDASIDALGFGGVAPTPVSAEVLAALPTGPVLSRAAVGVSEKG
jgi:type VII secretion protein EccB